MCVIMALVGEVRADVEPVVVVAVAGRQRYGRGGEVWSSPRQLNVTERTINAV
jgi:hypothetical protein